MLLEKTHDVRDLQKISNEDRKTVKYGTETSEHKEYQTELYSFVQISPVNINCQLL